MKFNGSAASIYEYLPPRRRQQKVKTSRGLTRLGLVMTTTGVAANLRIGEMKKLTEMTECLLNLRKI